MKRRAPWLLGAAAAALLAWWWFGATAVAPGVQLAEAGGRAEISIQALAATPASAASAAPAGPGGPPLSALGEAERRAQAVLWQGRLLRAEQALAAYEAAAQYPHGSRPIEEHPDQVRPFAPIEEDRALRMPGGTAPQGVRLRTTQERVFASGNESSRVTLALQDLSGRALPLRATRAVIKEVTPPGQTASTAEFAAPVSTAADGTLSVVMHPAAQGFGSFAGTVRLEMLLDHHSQPGFIYFDLVYSPDTAATWSGGVREALEQGSLNLYLKVLVAQPGRYVVSGRIDDARGEPVAIALFNQDMPRGPGEFRLPVFGKLIRDKQPAFPLRLRDVEAFLLKPDTFPDRVMLPRLAGLVHTSQTYPLASFSTDAWASEERDRYLTELGKDVDEARARLKQLGPP
jgi:hypothetical protein